MREISGLGIPALTAFQAVNLLGDISGKTVLVTGASSAVGHYVTQLAVLRGANVIGTVGSAEKAAHAKSAGAFATINYKQEPVAERVRELAAGGKVDAIIDMDFSTTTRLIADGVVAPHGTVVSYGSNSVDEHPVPFRTLLFSSISLRFFLVYDLSPADRQTTVDGLTRGPRRIRKKSYVKL